MKTILEVIRDLRVDDPPLEYLQLDDGVELGKFLEFEMIEWNGMGRIVPTEALHLPGRPGDQSYMYRGQTVHYPTCVPSLFRGPNTNEPQLVARMSLERMRVSELELVLQNHPFTEVAAKHSASVDFHGLAQHYGIPTSLLDLTSNIEIAAFFAVAHWDNENQAFIPMESGRGVMYRFDWTAFGPGYSKFFNPVGFGPGLRPARQHAWTFRLKPGRDFQSFPHVTTIEFDHCFKASAELFERFSDGKWLYPPDCLVQLVERLRDLPFVTMHAIRHAAKSDAVPENEIEVASERCAHFINSMLGIEVVDGHRLRCENEDIEIARDQAAQLDTALSEMRKGFRMIGTPRDNVESNSNNSP